jgi:hypothetical protein
MAVSQKTMGRTMKNKCPKYLQVISTFILVAVAVGCVDQDAALTRVFNPTKRTSTQEPITVNILVDDFKPQPYQGESVYFFNRLEGDRGALNDSALDWADGQVTATISSGKEWGGIWMSLNHPIREGLPIDFSAIAPWPILPAYQSQITGISVQIASGTPGLTLRLELKDGGDLSWKHEFKLDGVEQAINAELPALGNINQLVIVLDNATAGDFVVLKRISMTAIVPTSDTGTDAFVWSYGMLLNNWNPATGLVRDKAKDASGEFDAIQATGSLAAATAVAQQLGVISRPDAAEIVNKISDSLLLKLPRFHGLWPHWVKTSSTGEFVIVDQTEWSSVDTVIAAIGLLEAQTSLGLDTSGTEQLLKEIDWNDLVTEKGISHGYSYDGDLIPYAWDAFGGESWLVELAYAGGTGQVAPLAYASPPTANGSGFIDELAWLFVPPPVRQDYWGTDWASYRTAVVEKQISYYPSHDSSSCFAQLDLFGLSAGEVPAPWMVAQNEMYQAYGIGGAFAPANDGSGLGTPVVVPHYSAMAVSRRADESVRMWDWLIENGYFTPLNNVESLTFANETDCGPENVQWNQLKGSWNLSLQALGWGRYLAEQQERTFTLWQSAEVNPFLKSGYAVLTGGTKSAFPRLSLLLIGLSPAVRPNTGVQSTTKGTLQTLGRLP